MDIRIEHLKKYTVRILSDVNAIPIPAPGEQFRIRTQTQINLISIILALLHKHEMVDEITISTYTLNKEAWEVLKDLMASKKLQRLNLFLASAYSFRNPEYYRLLKHECVELSQEYDIHLTFAQLHFKITLIRCGENYYQHEGSMNYSTNNLAEQLIFENRKPSYDYDYTFMHETILASNLKALEIIC
jgi:hypothetical protein